MEILNVYMIKHINSGKVKTVKGRNAHIYFIPKRIFRVHSLIILTVFLFCQINLCEIRALINSVTAVGDRHTRVNQIITVGKTTSINLGRAHMSCRPIDQRNSVLNPYPPQCRCFGSNQPQSASNCCPCLLHSGRVVLAGSVC